MRKEVLGRQTPAGAETANRWLGRLAREGRLACAGMNPFIEPSSRSAFPWPVDGSGHRRPESYLTPRPRKKSNHGPERVILTETSLRTV